MSEKTNDGEVRPPAPTEVGSDARELTRDWEVLFWAFLLFGLGRLAWRMRASIEDAYDET